MYVSVGNIDLSELLSSMDDQIAKAKEQALSRKDILDKVEKWKHSSEEEKWLDEYEQVTFYSYPYVLCLAPSLQLIISSNLSSLSL